MEGGRSHPPVRPQKEGVRPAGASVTMRHEVEAFKRLPPVEGRSFSRVQKVNFCDEHCKSIEPSACDRPVWLYCQW